MEISDPGVTWQYGGKTSELQMEDKKAHRPGWPWGRVLNSAQNKGTCRNKAPCQLSFPWLLGGVKPCLKWNPEALKGALSCRYHSVREEGRQSDLDKGRHFSHRNFMSCFEEKKEDSSLPQQQHSNHHLQPMRNRHHPELVFFPNERSFESILPTSLLKPNKSWPSFHLFGLAYGLP